MAQLAGSAGFCLSVHIRRALWDQIKPVPAVNVKQPRLTLGLLSTSPTLPPTHALQLFLGRLVLLQFRKLQQLGRKTDEEGRKQSQKDKY